MASLVMVRYQVAPGRASENEVLVRQVFDELAVTEPAGLGYATFVLEDRVSFVHIASLAPGSERTALAEVAAFARFKQGLSDRAVEPPVRSPLRLIGSYRMLGGAGE
jgi:hypothetical protein